MRDGVLETWNGSGNGLGDNSISQTVRELPAGTYVFGAYIGASKQRSEESNRDIVTGVNLFANDAKVAVATDDPDRSDVKWGHSAKFNVAATVTWISDGVACLKIYVFSIGFSSVCQY